MNEKFRNSAYTDQEIGYALAKEKTIICVIDGRENQRISPYGFIPNNVQAIKYFKNGDTDKEIFVSLLKKILNLL